MCFFTLFHLFIFMPSFLTLLFPPLLIFPHLFPSFPRVRQFIEMVNGTDSEVRCLGGRSPKSQDSYPGSPRPFSSPSHKASSSQPYLTGTVQHYSHHSECENFTYLWGEKRPEANKRGKKYFFLSLTWAQIYISLQTPSLHPCLNLCLQHKLKPTTFFSSWMTQMFL